MSNEFPRMLFKFPGAEPIHGALFATKIVNDQDEQDEALAAGWSLTTPAAKEAHAESLKPPVVAVVAEPAPAPEPVAAAPAPSEDEPDTDTDAHKSERDQLKATAAAVGVIYPRNVTNDKLRELIAAAPAPAEG